MSKIKQLVLKFFKKYGFLIFFFGLTTVFFWHFLIPGSVDIVSFSGHMSGDTTGYFYPSKFYTIKMLSSGKWPLWNPYFYSGYPHYADPQSQIYYPLNVLLILCEKLGILNFYTFELFSIFHIFLASVFAYLFGKKMLKNEIAAYLIGVIYGFSNLTLIHLAAVTLVVPLAYIPLVLLATFSFIEKEKGKNVGEFVFLVLSLSILGTGGYPGLLISTVLFVFFIFLYYIFVQKKPKLILYFLGACFLTGLILSVIILPAQTLAKLSVGGNFGYSDPEANWKFSNYPASFLLTFIFPDNPAWGQGSLYIGLWTFLFACFAVGQLFKKKDSKLSLYLVLVVLAAMLMMGRDNFLYYLFSIIVPGFSTFRFPEMIGFFLILFLAVLGGSVVGGIEEKDDTSKNLLKKVLSGCLILYLLIISVFYFMVYFFKMVELEAFTNKQFYIFVFFLLMWLWYNAYLKRFVDFKKFKIGLLILLVFELLTVNKPIMSMRESPYKKYEMNNLVSKLKELQSKELFRLGGYSNNLFGAGGGSVFGIDTIFGHGTRMNLKNYRLTGLEMKYGWADYLNKSYYKFLSEEQFYDLLNVKYVMIGEKETPKPGYKLLETFKDETKESEFWPPANISLYERTSAYPRFFFAENWKHVNNLEDLAKELKRRSDLNNFVVFSGKKTGIKEVSGEVENFNILSFDEHKGFIDGDIIGNLYTLNLSGLDNSYKSEVKYLLKIEYENPYGGLDSNGLVYFGKDVKELEEIGGYNPTLLSSGLIYTGSEKSEKGTISYDISKYLNSPGEYFVKFKYLQGQSALMPRKVALVETAKNRNKNEINLIKYDGQSAYLAVSLETDGFLVFSDVYYPGWKAKVDGGNADVKEINGFLKGVYLTEGTHNIRFYFSPNDWEIGSKLSLLGLILLFSLIIFKHFSVRSKDKKE